MTPTELNEITGKIIEFSIKVHKSLGPGMLEGAYEICLTHELVKHGFKVEGRRSCQLFTMVFVWTPATDSICW